MSTSTPNLMNDLLGKLTPAAGRELPFVSVVTPSWNRKTFLPWLVYMFRYQDYPAHRRELIILDDSDESHQRIIDTLTGGQPQNFNIRYVYHPERLTLGKKRNLLNEMATGEYILCMDDDDYYPADKISYTIEMMQRHRALISGSDRILIWYSHIDRLFKTHAFGNKHILNGTFCYHRNYLKKHRYDDAAMLAEEVAFTDHYRVTPLQLPPERTILCISHSQNTFDKDYVLGSSEPLTTSLAEHISDPMLLAWYQSLHTAVHSQPVQWRAIDKVLVINRNARTDRWQQSQDELRQMGVPDDKWVRVPACENENGALGRRDSWRKALELAQENGRNVLILEDDVVLLKQQKHVLALNGLLQALEILPWQAVILGGRVRSGQGMKSLPGVMRIGSVDKVCALLVNASYTTTLIEQMRQDFSTTPEAQWAPLMRQGKWLGFSPALCYQRPGYSDIEKRATDNTPFYFQRVNKNARAEQLIASQKPIANLLAESIGFFIAAPFHWQVYQPIVEQLLDAGHRCELLVDDTVNAHLLERISEMLGGIRDPRLPGSRLSETRNRQQCYAVLVSTCYHPGLHGLAQRHVRAMAGLDQPEWDHAWWNAFYHRILCYAPYSQQALNITGAATLTGNPRLACVPVISEVSAKPCIVYAPGIDEVGTLKYWVPLLERLQREYTLITVLQHGAQYQTVSDTAAAILKHQLKKGVTDHAQTPALLRRAAWVIGDNLPLLFDALHLGTPVIALSHRDVCEAAGIPVVSDMAQLREVLDAPALSASEEKRRHYCDAFMDGQAAVRAAQAILIERDAPSPVSSLLHSLQQKLFG